MNCEVLTVLGILTVAIVSAAIPKGKVNSVLREVLIFLGILVVAIAVATIPNANNFYVGLVLLVYGYPLYVLIRLIIWSCKLLIRYIRKLKNEHKPFLNKTTLSIEVGIAIVVLAFVAYDAMCNKGPTAIVVDAETGLPIEGAVALAQWHRSASGGIEGGSLAFVKAQESFSGHEGRIKIKGYWGLNIFTQAPTLTVYKPEYVLWHSREICPMYKKRKDFDGKHRLVRLLKFDLEAQRWIKEQWDEGRGGPCAMQDMFFSHCYDSAVNRKYKKSEIKFEKIFSEHEQPCIEKDWKVLRESRKTIRKSK